MIQRKWLLGCAGLLALACQSSVFAENRAGAFTFTLADAYYHFDNGRHLDNIGLPNAAIAYDFTDRWAVEFGYGVVNTDPTSSANNGNRGVHGNLYLLDAIYRFNKMKVFDPYLIGGIGVLGLKPISTDTEHQTNLNLGVGTQIFFGDDVAIRGEVRDLLTTTGVTKNDWMVNIGISILFGGKTQPAEPVMKQAYKGENKKPLSSPEKSQNSGT